VAKGGTSPARPEPTALLEKLGVHLDPELLVLALTHRSFAHEAGGIPTNERLEFLGDTVLGLVVTEALYRRHPDQSEGDLARMRAATVSQRALAAVARNLGLGKYVLLGKGEIRTRGFEKDSILSDTVEALIGATYLSHGLETSRALVHRLVDSTLDVAAGLGAGLDWKTSLQEASAERGLGSPDYIATFEGPEHARVFHSTVVIDGVTYGSGSGTAKKHAEQGAAEETYRALLEKFPLPGAEADGRAAENKAAENKAAENKAADGKSAASKAPAAGA
jgi:ribonuclease III